MNLRSHVFLTFLTHAATEGIRASQYDPAAPNCEPTQRRTSVLFDAPFGSIPMRVSIGDWRFDEARIAVAAWPTGEADKWIDCITANGLAGDATAIGYLERRKDGRLMLSNPFEPLVFMRPHRRSALSAMPMPTDATDPLRLYPRYLNIASAA